MQASEAYEKVRAAASGSAVVVLGSSDCCMSEVANHLLVGLGVAPAVVELDGDAVDLLRRLLPLPAVFVGGRLLGGIDSLITAHINGSLVPLLKDAGALWL